VTKLIHRYQKIWAIGESEAMHDWASAFVGKISLMGLTTLAPKKACERQAASGAIPEGGTKTNQRAPRFAGTHAHVPLKASLRRHPQNKRLLSIFG